MPEGFRDMSFKFIIQFWREDFGIYRSAGNFDLGNDVGGGVIVWKKDNKQFKGWNLKEDDWGWSIMK